MLRKVVSCQLSVVSCRSRSVDPRTTDPGPRTSARSSLLAARSCRPGLSLTEVLIAMGILTLGLLGVASIFPVGSYYMQKADIADRGSAIAQSVMNEIVTRGMLDVRSWYVVAPVAAGTGGTGKLFSQDGLYSPMAKSGGLASNRIRGTFTRPFALTLNEALNQPQINPTPETRDETLIGKQFGNAYVIDPMAIGAMAFPDGLLPNPARNGPASVFPASCFGSGVNPYYGPSSASSSWNSWAGAWPVRHVTFRSPSSGWQVPPVIAAHYFQANDDLVTELPERDDRPAVQAWDTANLDGKSVPLSRQWTGDYSWLVTVTPTTGAARNALASNPEGHAYNVSVVVFYKRGLPDLATSVIETNPSMSDYFNAMGQYERAVGASVISTGLTGGELLLTDLRDNPTQSPFRDLKAGNWIMLCGPHPNSRNGADPPSSQPQFVLNWYQIISIEGRDRRLNSLGSDTPAPPSGDPERRLITVRGPQWAWQPSSIPSGLSNNLCVTICRGAVAVHSKTLRMESRSTGMAPFGNTGDPQLTPNRNTFY
jgi:hypothetical protein